MYKKVYHENFLKGNVFFKIVQQKRMTQLHPCDDMSITIEHYDICTMGDGSGFKEKWEI